MSAAEEWLKSGASFLSVYEKQKLMGFTDQEIATIFEELRDEMMAMINWHGIQGPMGWSGSSSPPPPPDPKIYNDDRTTVKIAVLGKNCKLVEGTDLHFKIKDLISWLVINAMDKNHGSLARGGPLLDNLKNDKNFFYAVENHLSKELMTIVKVIQVDAQKRHDFLNPLGAEEIMIGIALTLDQSYIDSYVDVDSERLIDEALRTINES